MTKTSIPAERKLPAIPKELEDRVNEVLARYTGKIALPIADEIESLGCDPDYTANQTIHIMVTEAARLAVLSAHAFLKRPPRRDFWIDATGEAFDEAVKWYADKFGLPAELGEG